MASRDCFDPVYHATHETTRSFYRTGADPAHVAPSEPSDAKLLTARWNEARRIAKQVHLDSALDVLKTTAGVAAAEAAQSTFK
jgi:hypothetical protein